ncbi:tRNA-dependent cyclodipeptide synthase [Streptomyces roseoverticillatus]|uniref:tRNA-dependent cyclodipeptide synthase n=1 Tax=Streptomyces roseoverticillatus TaxID=66429 RepID=UPI0033CA30EC
MSTTPGSTSTAGPGCSTARPTPAPWPGPGTPTGPTRQCAARAASRSAEPSCAPRARSPPLGPDLSARQIDQAAGYAIAALPFLLESPEIFETASSLFVHDQDTDLLGLFLSSRTGGLRPGPGLGYAQVQPPWYDSAPAHRL